MVLFDLIYNGITTTIEFNENAQIKEILDKFIEKTGKNRKEIYFFYEGKIIDENKTFIEVSNSEDKKRKKMTIIVSDIHETKIFNNSQNNNNITIKYEEKDYK